MDKSIPMLQDLKEVFFTEEQIQDRVNEIGKQITKDYFDYQDEGIAVVCITRGAVLFMADLIKRIDLHLSIDFIQASSYGNSSQSSGDVQIKFGDNFDYKNKHVIIAEDIIDSGLTLSVLCEKLKEKGAASVTVAVLLDKHKSKYELPVKYTCFDCPDAFIVGYGLDFLQEYRNLPYIGVMKEEIYKELL